MSTFLRNLIRRSLGQLPAIEPRLPPHFGRGTIAPGWQPGPLEVAGEESTAETRPNTSPRPAQTTAPARQLSSLERRPSMLDAATELTPPARPAPSARTTPRPRATNSAPPAIVEPDRAALDDRLEAIAGPVPERLMDQEWDAREPAGASVTGAARGDVLGSKSETPAAETKGLTRADERASRAPVTAVRAEPPAAVEPRVTRGEARSQVEPPLGATAWAEPPRRALAPAEPVVQVTIGRIEVRAVQPSPPSRLRAPRPRPKLSLSDYLRERDGGRP